MHSKTTLKQVLDMSGVLKKTLTINGQRWKVSTDEETTPHTVLLQRGMLRIKLRESQEGPAVRTLLIVDTSEGNTYSHGTFYSSDLTLGELVKKPRENMDDLLARAQAYMQRLNTAIAEMDAAQREHTKRD